MTKLAGKYKLCVLIMVSLKSLTVGTKMGLGATTVNGRRKQKKLREFLTRAKEKHGNKYDYNKVDFLSDLYKTQRKVTIICPIQGHKDFKQFTSDHLAGKGCTPCGNRETIRRRNEKRLAKGNCLGERYPHIFKEWDSSKNEPEIDAYNLPVRSTRMKYWWKCPAGKHISYKATTEDRTQRNHSCPKCSLAQSSKLELYVLSYIECIYHDVSWRVSIAGHEADFYIPSKGIVVELDGYPWHKDSADKDMKKTEFFASRGLRTIRLRDSRNPKIKGEIVNIINADYYTERPVEKLIQLMCFPEPFEIHSISTQAYQSYLMRLENYPAPPFERSLGSLIQNLNQVWSDQNNFDHRYLWIGENTGYWFICENCMEEFKVAPNELSNRYVNHSEVLCGECGRLKAIERKKTTYIEKNSLAAKNPELAKHWSDANLKSPSDVSVKGAGKYLWACPLGRHKDTARTLNDASNATFICRKCYLDSLSSENPNARKISITNSESNKTFHFTQIKDAAKAIGVRPETICRKIKESNQKSFIFKGYKVEPK